jgi:hypothetical protein
MPDSGTLVIPRRCTIVIDGKDQKDVPPELPSPPKDDKREGMTGFQTAMMVYQKTGHPDALQYLKTCMEWFAQGKAGPWDHYWGPALMDPLELCSNFELVDPATLEKIDNLLFDITIAGADYSLRLGPHSGQYGGRHQTYGTYGFFRSYRYLLRGAPNDAARQALEPLLAGSRAYLDSLLEGYRDDQEERESFHSASVFVRYAAGEGRFDWWTRGMGRLAAVRPLFFRDNLGFFCGSGGSWWSSSELRAPITEHDAIAAETFFGRDEGLASFNYRAGLSWTLQLPRFPPPPGIRHGAPESLFGARTLPMNPPHAQRLAARRGGDVNESLDSTRWFEKLVFRNGFSPQDQYLVVQGVNRASDANAIIRYTDRGHIFLMQTQQSQNHFFRNGVYVSRGVDEEASAPVAELGSIANYPEVSLAASRLRHHQGMDWQRNIIWRRGQYFVVLDVCRAEEAGKYAISCVWRSPNRGKLAGNTWSVRQGEDDFVLRSGTPAALSLDAISHRPLTDFTGTPGFMLRQDHSGTKERGGTTVFQNLFFTKHQSDERDFDIRSLGEHAVVVKSSAGDQASDRQELAVIGVGPWSDGPLAVDADLFYIADNGVYLAGGKRRASFNGAPIQSGNAELTEFLKRQWNRAAASTAATSATPAATTRTTPVAQVEPLWSSHVDFIRPARIDTLSVTSNKPFVRGSPDDLLDGQMPMYFNLNTGWAKQTQLTFDLGETQPVAEIDLRFEGEQKSADGVRIELSNDRFQRDKRPLEYTPKVVDLYEAPWWAYGFRLFRGATAPVNQDARYVRMTMSSASTGAEVIFRRAGTRHARPRSLEAVDLDQDGTQEVVAASDLEEVAVFSASGKRLWSHRLEGWISGVLCADMENDGRKEVIVSTFDWNVYVFAHDGTLRWRFHDDIHSSGAGSVALWKRDAQGRAQIVAAGYTNVMLLTHDGKKIDFPDLGGVRMGPQLPRGVDLDDDGVDDSVIHGFWNNRLFILSGKSIAEAGAVSVPAGPAFEVRLVEQAAGVARVLCVTAGGAVMTKITSPKIRPGPPAEDSSGMGRKPTTAPVTPSFDVEWKHVLGPMTACAVRSNAADLRIALGKRDGHLLLLNHQGKVLRHESAGGSVRDMAWESDDESALLAVAMEHGVEVFDSALRRQASFSVPDCGAVTWMKIDGRRSLVTMTDHGQVQAFSFK